MPLLINQMPIAKEKPFAQPQPMKNREAKGFSRQKRVSLDPWQSLTEAQPFPDSGHILLPYTRFCENKALLKQSSVSLGVMISGDSDIQQVIRDTRIFPALKLVVIEIATFTDGRVFSFARLLRRAGFQGEIRATGDVTRDRLFFLQRCGFNAFDIPEARYSPELHQAFTEVSVHYQGAADHAKPIYRQAIQE